MQTIRVTQPAELLSAVPYLIGFHPSDSLVVIGIRGTRLHFAARADLQECHAKPQDSAQHLASLLARQHIDGIVIIGYGSVAQVTEVISAFRQAATDQHLRIVNVLRVTDGRFYSPDCLDPSCCPPEGRVFRPDTSVIAAEATLAGYVALPDREALVQQLAPDPDVSEAMAHATNRAEARFIAALEQPGGRSTLIAEGVGMVEAALSRHYLGKPLTHDEVAWLSMVTLLVEVRESACRMIESRPDDRHISLWTDVVRKARPGTAAPAACLLSYAAYLSGQGSLASVAIDRAHADDPNYPMVQVMHDALVRGLPPQQLRRRRTRCRRQRKGMAIR